MSATDTRIENRDAQLVMLDQQLALGAYLQALLRPAPNEAPAEPSAPTVIATPPAAPPEPVAVVETTVLAPVAARPEAPVSPYPDWARDDFQCLLFQVAGLTLALPLARLSGVLPWDAEAVTPMPNHQPWFLGLREHLGQQVKLIDVAGIVLPPDRHAALTPAGSGRLGKVILIDGGRWGLACDAVDEVIGLAPADVKWRGQAGSRPWLAGTVIQRMCALIDTEAFAAMLAG
jgi:purine-binding chemotaxis protein CheW